MRQNMHRAYCQSAYLENILLFWNISCAMSKVYLHFTVENAETPENRCRISAFV